MSPYRQPAPAPRPREFGAERAVRWGLWAALGGLVVSVVVASVWLEVLRPPLVVCQALVLGWNLLWCRRLRRQLWALSTVWRTS